MKKIVITLLLLLAACTPPAPAVLPPQPTIDGNWGFEFGHAAKDDRVCYQYLPGGGGQVACPPEMWPPRDWAAWWREGYECADGWVIGRPEVRVIGRTPDPFRIHSGGGAAMLFTSWRCHDAGLVTLVPVEPGREYVFSAYAHAWYSRCSEHAHHDCPLDVDCATCANWAWQRFAIGVDPTGGVDPFASTVVWSEPMEQYGRYDRKLRVRVTAEAETVALFLRSATSHPFKHNDAYIDSVAMMEVETTVWLPIVGY